MDSVSIWPRCWATPVEHGCFNFDKMDAGNALNRIVNDLPPACGGVAAASI
jgi:hypothetical protein